MNLLIFNFRRLRNAGTMKVGTSWRAKGCRCHEDSPCRMSVWKAMDWIENRILMFLVSISK